MIKKEVAVGPFGRIIIMDSITKLAPGDEGSFVVSASHGGASSGEFSLVMPLGGVFFNDAGVGKDDAGVAALDMLQQSEVPAGTVSHESARIGDAIDTWEHGIISRVNQAASSAGLKVGMRLKTALNTLVTKP
jgi:hypothetical protein